MNRGLGNMAAWALALTPLGCAQVLGIDDPPPVGCRGPAAGAIVAIKGCAEAPTMVTPVVCKDDAGDLKRIQDAIDGASAVALSGTCDLGEGSLELTSQCFLGGDATLKYRGTGYAIVSKGVRNSVTGLTFDGGGIELSLVDTENATGQYGWNITCNRFQNITKGSDAVHVDNIIGKGLPSTISHNHFSNIWGYGQGYPDFPTDPDMPGEAVSGYGIYFNMGLDEVTVDDNTFDEIGLNAIKGFWDGFNGTEASFTGRHVLISNNVMTRVHRMGIEFQNIGQQNCPGMCDGNHPGSDGTVFKNNFYRQPAFSQRGISSVTGVETAFSFQSGSTHSLILNNTAIDDVSECVAPLGVAMPNSMDGGILRGNVLGTVRQSCADGDNSTHGWKHYIVPGFNPAGFTNHYDNNIACGPSATAYTSGKHNPVASVAEFNFTADACPGGSELAQSDLEIAFTTADHQELSAEAEGTWRISATSRLSIKAVDFYLDCRSAPEASQEIQDVNPDFASSRAWLYHATLDLSKLEPGPHFISAVATDVAGTTRSVEQFFSR